MRNQVFQFREPILAEIQTTLPTDGEVPVMIVALLTTTAEILNVQRKVIKTSPIEAEVVAEDSNQEAGVDLEAVETTP